MEIPLWLLVLLLLSNLLLGLVLWSRRRRRSPKLDIHPEPSIAESLPALAGLTHGSVIPGNDVEIIQNGAFFDQLLERIGRATRSVHFETFLWQDGDLGRRLADCLVERAQSGVPVRVLVDAHGGIDMGEETESRLGDSGCKFTKFRRHRLRRLGRMNERDHRKLVVLDGREAFVGGHCVVDTWTGQAQDREHFRDISVRVEGPAVHELQATFAENWVEATGELLFGEACFPELDFRGEVIAHVARIKPEGAESAVKILHHAVIALARQRVWIQNPYFLPEPEAIEALGRAVERGVDVRVMVPSTDASDMPLVQRTAQHNFTRLLELGVRLFEYERTLLHQKVLTVDGAWCAVGSSNFDDRSFEINDEITVGFLSEDLARRLEDTFTDDLEHCREVKPEEWAKRGWYRRVRERILYLVNEEL